MIRIAITGSGDPVILRNRRAGIAEAVFDENGTASIGLDGGEDAWNAKKG